MSILRESLFQHPLHEKRYPTPGDAGVDGVFRILDAYDGTYSEEL
jgi:hypothetical protein